MSEEHPAKRQRVEPKGVSVLRLAFEYLLKLPTATTSNILVAYPPFREEHPVRTHIDDVNSENVDFFQTLKGCSLVKICGGAAFNGNLPLIKKFIGQPRITTELYDSISHGAIAADNIEILAYVGSLSSPTPGRNYALLAAKYGAVKVLNIFANEDVLSCHTVHARTLDWAIERNGGVVKDEWKSKNFNFWSRAARNSVTAMERAYSLGFYCPLDLIYKLAFATNSRGVMQWAYEHGAQFTETMPALIDDYYEDDTVALFNKHFSARYDRIKSKKWKYRNRQVTLLRGDYYNLLNAGVLEECGNPEFQFEKDDIWCHLEFSNLTRSKMAFLLEKGFPQECVPTLFCVALQSAPFDVCKFLYETFPERCELAWPDDLNLPKCETNERWDWLQELSPLTREVALEFAKTAIQVGELDSLEWVLEHVHKEDLQECMETAIDYMSEREWDISEVAKIYPKFPKLPDDFKLAPDGVKTKETIQFLVQYKIPIPAGFQPFWPDDFDFLNENLEYFGWSPLLPRMLMQNWSEENLRRYLHDESRLQQLGDEDSDAGSNFAE